MTWSHVAFASLQLHGFPLPIQMEKRTVWLALLSTARVRLITQPVVMPEISALAVSGDGTLENVGIGVHLTPKLSVVGGCPNFRRSVLGRIEAAFLN